MLNQQNQELNQLLNQVANGDKEALKLLYQKASPKLYAISLRITQQKWLSEEAIQDSFLKIWHKATQFDETKASAITWCGTIVRNSSIDLMRKQDSKPTQSIDENSVYEVADYHSSPEQSATTDSQMRVINECLETLNPKSKDILTLAYNHGYTQQQIADIKSVPLGSVKTWIHRSIKSIKQCVENHR